MFELAVCQPPEIVSVLEAPAPSPAGGILEDLLFPLHVLREQMIATTGLGLDHDEQEDAVGAVVTRHVLHDDALGVDLSYLAAGASDGRRVIFLHGTPGAAEEWIPFLRAVPSGYLYVAPDRPGFGLTAPDESVPELARHAAALRGLLEAPSGAAPVLVGYSYGAPVALRAAVDMPERVGGVLLISGAIDPAQEDAHFLQWLADLEPVSSLLPRHLVNANDELLALPGELAALAGDLRGMGVPVVALHGTADTLAPPENLAFLQRLLPATAPLRIFAVDGADHFLPWSHPDAVTRALACLLTVAPREGSGLVAPAP